MGMNKKWLFHALTFHVESTEKFTGSLGAGGGIAVAETLSLLVGFFVEGFTLGGMVA
jgi:hypothetical protein